MTDLEDEIEYLDEDEEIVQQCVQTASLYTSSTPLPCPIKTEPGLLNQRHVAAPKQKRKISHHDEDSSDYDPTEDLMLNLVKKRKVPAPKQKQPQNVISIEKRRKMDIQIPDYEDPLCLPVKMLKRDQTGEKRLRDWNHLCLKHLETSDAIFKSKTGETIASKRTVVLRHVQNNLTGKVEVSVWGKTVINSSDGEISTEVYQAILPKYKEKKLLSYDMPVQRKRKSGSAVDTVLLTREEHKQGQVLVAYKPAEGLSAVYRMEEGNDTDNSSPQRRLSEIVVARACAACYQASWRHTSTGQDNKDIRCTICSRTFVSVYNFLSHIKTHSAQQVNRDKRRISRILAQIVGYHYKCRLCQNDFASIKDLRTHVRTAHASKEIFMCEIGNHLTH